jgi:signal peptidase I
MSAMASDETSVRFPWVALALSFLSSGVGHIYCGRIVKGLLLYSARFLLPLLCIIAAFAQPSTGVLVGLILVPAAVTVIIFLYSAIDAYVIAKRTPPDYKLKEYNRTSLYWLLVAMQLAYPVALTWGVREYVYEAFLIPTRNMSPNFLTGDRVLVNKRPFRDGFPQRGDVIVFRTPSPEVGHAWIERVIGVAGDRIVIKGREIEVNGKKLEHERVPRDSIAQIRRQVEGNVHYESNADRRYRVLHADDPLDKSATDEINVTVPDRSVFVIGDNRDRSRDSRHIGSIHVGDVIGYVDYIYFPAETWSRFGVYRD